VKEQYFAGMDIGSRMTKVVIMGEAVLSSHVVSTGPEQRKLANKVMEEALAKAKLSFDDLTYVVATGYGRINVPFADKQITEITCHARGIGHLLPSVKTVIDIGGQDTKGIKLKDGRPVDFVMNDKCAAGTGRFLELMAEGLGVELEDIGKISLTARHRTVLSSTCTVFAEQEAVTELSKGVPVEDLLAGLHEAIAARIYSLVARLKIEKDIAVTGGGAKNIGLIKALEEKFGYPVVVPPEPLVTGALGAALLAGDAAREAAGSGSPLARSERRLNEARFF